MGHFYGAKNAPYGVFELQFLHKCIQENVLSWSDQAGSEWSGQKILPPDHLQRNKRHPEIGENLESRVVVRGQPLTEPKLEKDKKAPDEHSDQTAWPSIAKKLTAQESAGRQREGRQFRRGEEPERCGKARHSGQDRLAKFIPKPGRHTIDHLPDARETPEYQEEQIDG